MKNRQSLGTVISVRDTIANVAGLTSVTSGEMVTDIRGNIGLVLNLTKT
jgi:F0F1-type ATP synthase alpha subunit